MPFHSFRPVLVRVLVVALLGGAGLAVTSPARATSPTTGLVQGLTCAVGKLTGTLTESMPLARALALGLDRALVAARNDLPLADVDRWASDASTWVDPCGSLFVVEEPSEGATATAAAAPATGMPADVFDLSSRPASDHTIYLDFDGATVSGTAWRGGERIDSPAYSLDADTATFSEAERAQIYQAWRTVAEDYAPFDVNVTTRVPAPGALTRSDASDPTYGIPAVITSTNSVGRDCSCAGVAYVGTVGSTDSSHQPAWVFTDGSGTSGWDMGQAISHEVGHGFGLSHDGTSGSSYYSGALGWAPIMGASYGQRASQWSAGEYAGATNTQDDVAIIARTAPVLADDHAAGAVGATRIAPGTRTDGVITSRTDRDAFTFTASGATRITVAGPSGVSDLDVGLTVLDAVGREVARVDPSARTASDASMSATWTADLPSGGATYTVVVDGVGHGSPSEAGGYSDYASLGAYTVSLGDATAAQPPTDGTTTDPDGTGTGTTQPPMRFVTNRLPRAKVGKRYWAAIRFAGPVSKATVRWRLPQGLRWRAKRHRIVIRGTARRSSVTKVRTVIKGQGRTVRQRFRLVAR